jgi:Flp pilus assembly pilin Flp
MVSDTGFGFDPKSFHVCRPGQFSTLGKGGESHMTHFNTLVARARNEEGQTMAEYGVVLAVITVACVTVFGLLATDITAAIDAVRAILPGS